MTAIQRALSGLAIACASLSAMNAAQANSFDVNFQSNSNSLTAQLVITTPGDASSWETVTDISGTVNGQGVAGLLPYRSFGGNDNKFSTTDLFTIWGLSFTDTSGAYWNIYTVNSNGFLDSYTVNSWGSISISPHVSTPIAAPVPEPETYAMLMAGMGVLGAMSRRQKKQACRAALAA